jgi:raffinose/stachyose/melibiose transport system substrate-binding protein
MKRSVFVAVALLSALSVFASGGREESGTAGKKKVVWWTPAREESIKPLIQKVFVDSFSAAHPGVQLELVYMEDYYRTTQTAVQAGAGPDLIQLGGPSYAIEYWEAKQIADLRDYGAKYGWGEKLLPWAYESGKTRDGSLISLPLQYESLVLFYNKTALNKLGFQPPTNLEEFNRIAKAAKEKGIMVFAHFFARNRWQFPAMWGGYAGHDNFYRATIQQMRWDDPLFVQAMTLWNKQVQDGYWAADLKTYYSLKSEDSYSLMAEGKALMMINGTWSFRTLLPEFKETGQEWDWVKTPTWRPGVEQVYDLSVGESLCLSAKSTSPDSAAQVIDWLFSDRKRAAQLAEIHNLSDWFVPLKFEASDFSAALDPRISRWIEDFTRVTAQGKFGYPIWGYWPPQAKTWAEKEIAKVHNGEMSPEAFMKAFQQEYAAQYAKANMPVPPKPNLDSPK